MSGSHTFSLTACPPECNFQTETKIEPDPRLPFLLVMSVQYALLLHMTLTLGRICRIDQTAWPAKGTFVSEAAGLLFHASPLSVSLSFTFLQLLLYT